MAIPDERTASWLEPMTREANNLGLEVIMMDLMMLASAPEGSAVDSTGPLDVDWIKFGRLLRDRLGWVSYPDNP